MDCSQLVWSMKHCLPDCWKRRGARFGLVCLLDCRRQHTLKVALYSVFEMEYTHPCILTAVVGCVGAL